MCTGVQEVAADVLAEVFATISNYVPEFIKWVFCTQTTDWEVWQQHWNCTSAVRISVTTAIHKFKYELQGPWVRRTMQRWDSLLLFTGTVKDCPIYGGEWKGLLNRYVQWSDCQ